MGVRTLLFGLSLALPVALPVSGQANELPPLLSDSPAIRDCRGGEALTLPVITWGADYVTHYANGGANPQPGSLIADFVPVPVTLERVDDFRAQVEAYLACDTPFLRGTQGMINLVSDVTEADPRTEMVAVWQHSYSNGGDVLVAGSGIASPADLAGKRIAVQAYGPHVYYMVRVLTDAGLSLEDVEVVWTTDLFGIDGDTPAGALLGGTADAAFVILPDALTLTSGGGTGTGAEGSVNGAEILLSTRSANRVISDVYVVRRDFYDANRPVVDGLVQALALGEELLRADIADGAFDYAAVAEFFLDDSGALADAEGLWLDAETVGISGQTRFTDPQALRGWLSLNNEIQAAWLDLGLLQGTHGLEVIDTNWQTTAADLGLEIAETVARFDAAEVERVVTQRAAQGTLEEGSLFSFEINFQPNQNTFPVDLYQEDFERVVELAATYGGAVITVEGHSDPLNYLRQRQDGATTVELRRIQQAARNLSITRATSVRDAILEVAGQMAQPMDPGQFATLGMGITTPKTGMCGSLPCAPETEDAWLSNMRVVFRIVGVEAESSVFVPLD